MNKFIFVPVNISMDCRQAFRTFMCVWHFCALTLLPPLYLYLVLSVDVARIVFWNSMCKCGRVFVPLEIVVVCHHCRHRLLPTKIYMSKMSIHPTFDCSAVGFLEMKVPERCRNRERGKEREKERKNVSSNAVQLNLL